MTLDDSPLHVLWSKAVGTPDYDKSQWKELEAKLHRAMRTADDLLKACMAAEAFDWKSGEGAARVYEQLRAAIAKATGS